MKRDDCNFQLFETMHATKEAGFRYLDQHLRRMSASAHYLGFKFNEYRVRESLFARCTEMEPGISYRIRIMLNNDGEFECIIAQLTPLKGETVFVLLAEEQGFGRQSSQNKWLRHKTTFRETYDSAWRMAENLGAFDMLFFNERGELTEGGRTNVFVKRSSRWWTPPLSSGLLPGIMRNLLLENLEWDAQERVLTIEDLEEAEELALCNSLRGVMRAKLLRGAGLVRV